MENSVKVLWIFAGVSLVATAILGLNGLIWQAFSFLLTAAAMSFAAFSHNKACLARDEAVLKAKEEAALAVEAAHERENAATLKAKEDILRFHSLISHGMRIPISIIIGYSDLMRDGLVPDEKAREEYIGKICDKATYMNDLLSHVLLDMRFETQMPGILKQPVEIVGLLTRISDEMLSIANKSGVNIYVVAAQEKLYTEGDTLGLTKTFYNILENSLKYMNRHGSINITASKAGDEIIIVFKDDGQGLPSDEAARIFELNYQGSNRKSGNGLGLYVVKTEIQAHGGSIYAKSDIGHGMGIYITLPLLLEKPAQTSELPSISNAEEAAAKDMVVA